MFKYIIICSFFLFTPVYVFSQGLTFRGGHSHNDYHQMRPLYEAYECGMASIEADVFYRGGTLLVGHSASELAENMTLETMYLNPLKKIVEEKQDEFEPLVLLIDIKEQGETVYRKLAEILENYKNMLSEYSDGKVTKRQVTIILSGDRPVDLLRHEKNRFAFIDGRMIENDMDDTSSLIPLISADWGLHFNWDGKGNISKQEFSKLKMMVENCHQNHKIIRFWGFPNQPGIREHFWKVFEEAGVDLIGNDCPSCLKDYLSNHK